VASFAALLALLAGSATIHPLNTAHATADPVFLVGTAGPGCPSPAAATIAGGVALASPGDTVLVCPGTYAGGVTINKAGLKLMALGPLGSVKIVGTGGTGPVFGLTIIADNVRIEEFEIYGFNGKHDASGIFVGGLFAGDTAHPADAAVIEHNLIHDNGNGIYLWQSNNNHIRHNEVYKSMDFDGVEGTGILSFNGFGDAQTIIANNSGRSGKNNEISENKVHDNDRLGIFAGACTEAAFCEGPVGVHADISGTTINHDDVFKNGVKGTTEGLAGC